MISKETAVKIYNAHDQIEKGEKLVKELVDTLEKYKQDKEPTFFNAFGDRVGLHLGVPTGSDSSRLYGLDNQLGIKVIKAHVKNQKNILKSLMAIAKSELDE